jgi:hypothetical protein
MGAYGSLVRIGSDFCEISRPSPAADTERHLQMTVGLLEETQTLEVAIQVGSSLVPRIVLVMLQKAYKNK